jgi:hypothetical protein
MISHRDAAGICADWNASLAYIPTQSVQDAIVAAATTVSQTSGDCKSGDDKHQTLGLINVSLSHTVACCREKPG